MRKNKAKIFLAYTSNMVSSGIREIIRWLVEHKHIHVLVTTAGGIEEDLIKCFKPFILGRFDVSGKELRKKGINRIGNIFVPNDRYILYEEWINPILEEVYKKQKETNKVICVSEFIRLLGEKINNRESILYWASKNNIPVFCPAITDGSTGDMIFFFKQQNRDFLLDISEDIYRLNREAINAEKSGIIILGEGVIKHAVCNANLFRDGAEYAVYINSQSEFDASDSGATPEEAISWGKIKGKTIKIYADASLVFPLIVYAAFVNPQLKI